MRRNYRTLLVLALLAVVLLAEISDRGGVEAGSRRKTGGDRRRKNDRDGARENEGNVEGESI